MRKYWMFYLAGLFFPLIVWLFGFNFYIGFVTRAYKDRLSSLDQYLVSNVEEVKSKDYYNVERPFYDKTNKDEIQDLIVSYANMSDVNPQTALQIANCESGFRWDVKNPNSSALGIYQWTSDTWEAIGSPGDRLDPEDNIRAFMEYYPQYPSWWVCK